MLFLMRGLPGSGKTTKVQTLTKHIREALGDDRWAPKVFSADDYFMTENGYVHDISKLYLAHGQCYSLSKNSVMRHESPVIIDNTNVTKEDMKQYYDLAYYNWYKFYVIEPDTEWAFNVDSLIKKTVHDVPMYVLVRNTIKYYIPDGFETLEKYEDDSSFYFTGLKRSESGDSHNETDDRNHNSLRSRTNIQRGSGETDEYSRKEEGSRKTLEFRQHYRIEDKRLSQYQRKTSPDKYSSHGENRSRDPRTNTQRKSIFDEYFRKEGSPRRTPELGKRYRTEDNRQYQRKTSPDHKQYRSHGKHRSRDPRSKYYDRQTSADFGQSSRNDEIDRSPNIDYSPENEDLERKLNDDSEEDLWKYDLLGDCDYTDIPLPSNEIKKENECGKDANIHRPPPSNEFEKKKDTTIQLPVKHEIDEILSTLEEVVKKDNNPVDDISSKCTVVIEEKVKQRMKKQLNYFLKHRQDPKSVEKDEIDPKCAKDNRLHVKESNELETEQDTPQKSQDIVKKVKKPKNIQIKLGIVKTVNDIVSSGTTLTNEHTNEYVVASVTDKIVKPALETLNESRKITNETSKTNNLNEAHGNECLPDTETRKDKLLNEKESENVGTNKEEEEAVKPESDSEEGELSSEHSDNEENGENQVNNHNNAPEAVKEPEPEEEEEEIEEGEILDNDSDEEDGKSKAGSDDDIEIICEETSSSTTSTKHHPKRDVEKNRLRKQLMAIEEKIKAARRTKRRKRRESSSSSSSSGSKSSSSRSRSSSSSSSSS